MRRPCRRYVDQDQMLTSRQDEFVLDKTRRRSCATNAERVDVLMACINNVLM